MLRMSESGVDMRYDATLDGIRALAALIIVFFHAKVPWLAAGFLGVDIFFVLSGYLITRLLVAEHLGTGGINYRRFLIRRLRRLYPAMLAMLLAYLLVAPFVFSNTPFQKHLRDATWTALYIVNYSPSFGVLLSVLGHVWSLAVEVQFYLIWPLALILILKLPHRWGGGVLGLSYMTATVWRIWGGEHFADVWDFYVRTDTHCSGLILGGLLGYINPKIHRYWAWVGLFILSIALTFFSTRWLGTVWVGFTVAEVGAALLVVGSPAWLGNAVLAWVGRISYGLYLWHYPVMHALHAQKMQWEAVLVIGFIAGLIGAVFSYYFIERRFHKVSIKYGSRTGQTINTRVE